MIFFEPGHAVHVSGSTIGCGTELGAGTVVGSTIVVTAVAAVGDVAVAVSLATDDVVELVTSGDVSATEPFEPHDEAIAMAAMTTVSDRTTNGRRMSS